MPSTWNAVRLLVSLQQTAGLHTVNSRFRFLTALVAIGALLGFGLEGQWAAACASEMTASAAPLSDSAMDASGACPADRDIAVRSSSDTDGGGTKAPRCPLAPTMMGNSCVGVVAPPATAFAADDLRETRPLRWSAPAAAPDLLLAAAIFHPPIA